MSIRQEISFTSTFLAGNQSRRKGQSKQRATKAMSGKRDVHTYTSAAKIFGTNHKVISGIVKVKGIPTCPTGLSGRGARTGLDDRAIRILRDALKPA